MNANFTKRMALGCSILMAVCQSAALAGGKGGHSGGGNSGGSSHISNFSAVRSVNTFHPPVQIQKFQTLNTNSLRLNTNSLHVTPKVLHVTPRVLHVTPSFPYNNGIKVITNHHLPIVTGTGIRVPVTGVFQPTNGIKVPVGGIKVPGGGVLDPTTGGGSTPPGGGTGTPPSGGSSPPSYPTGPSCPTGGYCGKNCWPNWFCCNPGYCGNWGYGYCSGYASSYCSTPIVFNTVTTTPAVVSVPAASQLQTVAKAADKMTLKLGQSYTIVNDNFGEKAGDLSLAISGLTLPMRVDQWDAQQITFTVPFVGLEKPTDGTFQVGGADHKPIKAVPVMVVAAQ